MYRGTDNIWFIPGQLFVTTLDGLFITLAGCDHRIVSAADAGHSEIDRVITFGNEK